MRRGLKCPKCRQQNARKDYGYSELLHRRYHQKYCGSCGYQGRKVYYGGELSTAEYHQEMEEMHARITERLAFDQKVSELPPLPRQRCS